MMVKHKTYCYGDFEVMVIAKYLYSIFPEYNITRHPSREVDDEITKLNFDDCKYKDFYINHAANLLNDLIYEVKRKGK